MFAAQTMMTATMLLISAVIWFALSDVGIRRERTGRSMIEEGYRKTYVTRPQIFPLNVAHTYAIKSGEKVARLRRASREGYFSYNENAGYVFRGFRRPTATIAWLEKLRTRCACAPHRAASSPRGHTHTYTNIHRYTHTYFYPYQLLLKAPCFFTSSSRIYTDMTWIFFTHDVIIHTRLLSF